LAQALMILCLLFALLNASGLETSLLYGNIDHYGYYFVDLHVGTPGQLVSVIVDTGSTLISFPCSPCEHCGVHLDPLFDLSLSKTAKWVTCDECPHQLGECTNKDQCVYSQAYLEGSRLRGRWFQDTLSLSRTPLNTTVNNTPFFSGGDFSLPVRNISESSPAEHHLSHTNNSISHAILGCHNVETKLFYSQRADGIFGLAPPSYASVLFPENPKKGEAQDSKYTKKAEEQDTDKDDEDDDDEEDKDDEEEEEEDSRESIRLMSDDLPGVEDTHRLLSSTSYVSNPSGLLGRYSSFTLCFAKHGGLLQLGGVDESVHTSDMMFTPLVMAARYVVEVTSVMVNRTRIGEQFSAVIDSGSTFSYFSSQLYHQLTMLIYNAVGTQGPCWPASLPLDNFPPIHFFFGGSTANSVPWYPEDYLYLVRPRGAQHTDAFKNADQYTNGHAVPSTTTSDDHASTSTSWFASGTTSDGTPSRTQQRAVKAKRCLAFTHAKESIFGASWMQQKNVMFDITKGQLGVARAKCPERKVRDRNVFAQQEYKNPSHAEWTVRLVAVLLLLIFVCGFYDKYSRQARVSFDCDHNMRLRVPLEPILEEM